MKPIHLPSGVFRWLFIFLALFCCVFTVFYIYLPRIIETRILPAVLHKIGLNDLAGDVRSVGIFGMDLGNIRLGTSADPGLRIDAVQIDYHLSGLLNKEIDQIHISGVKVFSRYENHKIIIPGLLPSPLFEPAPDSIPPPASSTEKPGILIRRVQISNVEMILLNGKTTHKIPLDLEILPRGSDMKVLDVQLTAHPFGQQIDIKGQFDFAKQVCKLEAASNQIRLENLAKLTVSFKHLTLSGTANLVLSTQLNLSPFALSSLSANIGMNRFHAVYPGLELSNSADTNQNPLPVTLNVDIKNGHPWRLDLSGLALKSPAPIELEQLNCLMDHDGAGFNGKGDFKLSVSEPKKFSHVSLDPLTPFNIPGQFVFKYNEQGKWSFGVTNAEKQMTGPGGEFNFNEYVCSLGQPLFDISGNGDPTKKNADFSITIPRIKVSSGLAALNIPVFRIDGNLSLDADSPIVHLTGQADKTHISVDTTRIQVPDMTLTGTVTQTPSNPLAFSGSLGFFQRPHFRNIFKNNH